MVLLDERVFTVLHQLQEAGFQAVLVGGCVRDFLRGQTPHDYDCATSALPEEVMAACASLHCIPTGLKHGTVTVVCNGLPVEVTTFRREGRYSDHRRPDGVEFTPNLEEDLARRDFTVNAMALSEGQVIDPFGGQADLNVGLLRCVGTPTVRFQEDALRILRALRFSSQLDFVIHPKTDQALRDSAPLLAHVAQERITAEFLRLLCGPGAGRVLLEYALVVTLLFPELAPMVGFDQRNPHHHFDVYTHCVKALEAVPPEPVLRLAALLHDLGKPATFSLDQQGVGHFYGHAAASESLARELLGRMRLDHATRDRVLLLIARHDLPLSPTRKWVGRWLHRLGTEPFFQLLEFKRADQAAKGPVCPENERVRNQVESLAQELLTQQPCLSRKHLAVNGRDALAAGLTGPAIGRTLQQLLEKVAEGELPNDRDVLLNQLALTHPAHPGND